MYINFKGPPGEGPQIPPEILFQRDSPFSRYKRETDQDNEGSAPEEPKATEPSKDHDGLKDKLVNMYANIYVIRKQIDVMKKPIGNKDSPARTCRDLYFGHPDFQDGKLDSDDLLVLLFKREILQANIGLTLTLVQRMTP